MQYLQQGGGEGSAIGRSVCLAEAAWAPPSASVRRPRNLGLSAVHLRTEIAFGSDSFAGAAAAAVRPVWYNETSAGMEGRYEEEED